MVLVLWCFGAKSGKNVVVRLFSYVYKKEYFKYIILDGQYGVSILWDIEIEEAR